MIKALVFDMDGLLLDSERIVKRSWEEAGNILGILHMGDHIFHTLGMNRKGRNEYFKKAVGPDFPEEDFAKETGLRFYRIVEEEGLPVKPGAKELLAYGKERGFQIAIATSSRKEYAQKVLKEAGIAEYFDGGVFGDMVQHTKPHPEIYQKACESIKVKPEQCLALEDAPAGVRSAYAAGLKVIVVPDLVPPPEDILSLVCRRCETLHEVIPLLESGLI